MAGLAHFTETDRFLLIVPNWVPVPRLVVQITGACEIAGAVALLTPKLRRAAGLMLALYALCVLPANIKHAVEGVSVPGLPDTWWYHGPRLAFQPVLIWLALYSSHILDWPFRARPQRTRAPSRHGSPDGAGERATADGHGRRTLAGLSSRSVPTK